MGKAMSRRFAILVEPAPSRRQRLIPRPIRMTVTGFRTLIEALDAAPGERPFVTFWTDEDEQETLSFAEFRLRARGYATLLRRHGVGEGDCVVILMPQGLAAMTMFAAAMMLGAIPAIIAYPNFKIEPAKYSFGLAGVTANLHARAIVIDDEFPEEFLQHIKLGENAVLVRAGAGAEAAEDFVAAAVSPETSRSSSIRQGPPDCRRAWRCRMRRCCGNSRTWCECSTLTAPAIAFIAGCRCITTWG